MIYFQEKKELVSMNYHRMSILDHIYTFFLPRPDLQIAKIKYPENMHGEKILQKINSSENKLVYVI